MSTQLHSLIKIESHEGLCGKYKRRKGGSIHHVSPDRPMNIVIENFSKQRVKQNAKQVVAIADTHPEVVREPHISYGTVIWGRYDNDAH